MKYLIKSWYTIKKQPHKISWHSIIILLMPFYFIELNYATKDQGGGESVINEISDNASTLVRLNKKQKTEPLDWGLEILEQQDSRQFTVTNAEKVQFTFSYSLKKEEDMKIVRVLPPMGSTHFILKNDNEVLHDSTGEWACIGLRHHIILKNNQFKMVWKYLLVNPNNKYYIVLDEKPKVDENRYLLVKPNFLVPPLDFKNQEKYSISRNRLLNSKGIPIISGGTRFVFRSLQSKNRDNTLNVPLYSLHAIHADTNQEEGRINLSYYLERDFDFIPSGNVSHFKIMGHGKFISFLLGDKQWAIETKDIRGKCSKREKEDIYSPIMSIDGVTHTTDQCIYSDFLTIDPRKTTFNDYMNQHLRLASKGMKTEAKRISESNDIKLNNELYKDFILNEFQYIPVYATVEKVLDIKDNPIYKAKLTFFSRDQLRCRDINSFDFFSQQNIKNRLNLYPESYTIDSQRKIQEILNPDPVKGDIQDRYFNNISLPPKKITFEDKVFNKTNYISQRDTLFFTGYLANNKFSSCNDIEKNYLRDMFADEFFASFVNSNHSVLDSIGLYYLDAKNWYKDLYSNEFKMKLKQKGFISSNDEECITPIQTLEMIIRGFISKNYTFIDTNKGILIL